MRVVLRVRKLVELGGIEMDGMLFVCGIGACGLLWDFVLCLLAVLEWRAAWEGFKVCKNG